MGGRVAILGTVFFGIIISLYHREHGRPHFHVTYSEYDATIDIECGKVLAGKLPWRALARVRKWRKLHDVELMEDWRLVSPLRAFAANTLISAERATCGNSATAAAANRTPRRIALELSCMRCPPPRWLRTSQTVAACRLGS